MTMNPDRGRNGGKSSGIEGVFWLNDAAIEFAVREAVMALRDQAKIYALAKSYREDRAYSLLIMAAEVLIRQLKEHPESFPAIASLQDYLFDIYKRLVVFELEQEERWNRRASAHMRPVSHRPVSVRQLSRLVVPAAVKIILKLELLLVRFARWAGWLYFVDEHLLDDYIRYHKERIELARYIG